MKNASLKLSLFFVTAVILISPTVAQTTADGFVVRLEEPIHGEVHGGIGNLRGWAIAKGGIRKVEIFIDDAYAFDAPYGGSRPDINNTYPNVTDSMHSGFSLAYGYSNLSVGEHTITARAHSKDGRIKYANSTFTVISFHKDFISSFDEIDISQARTNIIGDKLLVSGISIASRLYNLMLDWRTAEQGFEITSIVNADDTSISQPCQISAHSNCSGSPNTVVVGDKEWAQVDLFAGLSWEEIDSVCPNGDCEGNLNGFDVTGWTWASIDEVSSLFNRYGIEPPLGPGPDGEYTSAVRSDYAEAFFSDKWRPTSMYGGNPNFVELKVIGHTNSINELDCCIIFQHYDAGIEFLQERDTETKNQYRRAQVFTNDIADPNYNQDDDIGAWLYRQL